MTRTTVETRAAGRPLVLVRSDWSQPGQCSIDILTAAARAREIRGAVCLLPATDTDMVPLASGDVPVVQPAGIHSVWVTTLFGVAAAQRALRESWRQTTASMSHELHREFRRHAGSEHLPLELRQGLREIANRAQKYTREAKSTAVLPRRLVRTAPAMVLAAEALELARAEAAAMGIPDDAPLVAFEARMRPDIAAAAIGFLSNRGYTVAIVGGRPIGLQPHASVVDLTARPLSPFVKLLLLSASRFVVSGSAAMQQLSYLTNTPSLTVNAADPFAGYPVRANGIFALKTPIDLDTGRTLAIEDLLTERYFRNLRNYGFREITTDELIGALEEMDAGVRNGWTETASQVRFRQRVIDSGTVLAATVPQVAEWGPDDGFIGDGRLARVQVERTS